MQFNLNFGKRSIRHSTLLLLLMVMTIYAQGAATVNASSTNRSVPSLSAACLQKQAPGLCRGKLLRYAYNEKTGNCVSFYYTGCASTDNNFLTFEECRRDCMQKLRY